MPEETPKHLIGDGSAHYGGDEIMQIMHKYGETPAIAVAIKHLLRLPKANALIDERQVRIQDLKKVLWYVEWEIRRRNG